ncbi:L-2-hydroxyglutarate oxidase [Klebsiella pneumoniae]|uniref:L-2-hydroxyglutarate oxidase n=1 Tax=Klebsiella pneumoniae TaxID=573 RepID=A0A377ZIM6_KLEPN|nr:L-2-hydroxyglutarate oxidase [Klebsiella pneumoniae]
MYDFVIIGGGIIGMSTAMQLIENLPGRPHCAAGKRAGPACHQTGHNSGVIHAGVYYTPGSLKAQFCLAGNAPPRLLRAETASAMNVCGKMLVATSPLEMERMRALWESHRRQRPAARVAKRRGATRARTEHYRARRDLRPFQRHR